MQWLLTLLPHKLTNEHRLIALNKSSLIVNTVLSGLLLPCAADAATIAAHFLTASNGHSISLLQSRSEVASEAENVLSELSHHLTHVVKEPLDDSHELQSKALQLHKFSQKMLARLRRLVPLMLFFRRSSSQWIHGL